MAATLTGLTGNVSSTVDLKGIQTEVDGTVEQAPVLHSLSIPYTFGTGAAQANELFAALVTITTGASEELDLYALAAVLGRTASLAKVKGIQIINLGTAADHLLQVGGAVAEAWEPWVKTAGDAIVIRPGASFQVACGAADTTGYAVVENTTDKLKLTNPGATTLTCKVTLWGVSG